MVDRKEKKYCEKNGYGMLEEMKKIGGRRSYNNINNKQRRRYSKMLCFGEEKVQ